MIRSQQQDPYSSRDLGTRTMGLLCMRTCTERTRPVIIAALPATVSFTLSAVHNSNRKGLAHTYTRYSTVRYAT